MKGRANFSGLRAVGDLMKNLTPRTWKGFAAAALCCIGLFVGGCGYQMDGFSSSSSRAHSVLGNGSSTIKFDKVEQITLFPWVQYYVRGVVRDEVNLRRLARWVDDGNADYLLTVNMTGFRVRSSISNRVDNTLLSTTTVSIDVIVRSGRTGAVVWKSGPVAYSDKFEVVDEASAVREGLKEAVRRALDRMQQEF